ncbi:hypothetical protein SDC9_137163 [bioreactor metagenome]|uniref:Uncharacterized protein n=1 Tax=bioreactor metagenome TaxID=1076179 RepID=A0A645DL88_9ZZZZ
MGTARFPLKKDKAIGNFTLLKRLYIAAATSPAKIPIKTFLLLIAPNAMFTCSTSTFVNNATDALLTKVIGVKKATNPAKAEEPSLSFDIPNAKPTANNNPKLSKIVLPALIKKAAKILLPPQPLGSIQ